MSAGRCAWILACAMAWHPAGAARAAEQPLPAVSTGSSTSSSPSAFQTLPSATLRQALASAGSITDLDLRSQAYADIAGAQADFDDAASALVTLAGAQEAAARIPLGPLADWSWHDIGVAQIKLEDPAAASASAQRIRDRALRGRLLGRIVAYHSLRGEFPRAIEIARRVAEAPQRDRLLREIVLAQARADDTGGALATTRLISAPEWQAGAIADVAAAEIRAGMTDGTPSLLERVRDPEMKGSVLAQIACAQADRGLIAPALHTLESVPEGVQRARALGRLGVAQARAGDTAVARESFAKAMDALDERIRDDRRADALLEAGHAQVSALQLEGALDAAARARRVVDGLRSQERKTTLLGNVARLLAEAGDAAGAVSAMRDLPANAATALVARDVASALAESGDLPRAIATARSLQNPAQRAYALLGVSTHQELAGDHIPATEIAGYAFEPARQVPDPELRAMIFAALARLFGRLGEPMRSRDAWTSAMEATTLMPTPQQQVAVYVGIAYAMQDASG